MMGDGVDSFRLGKTGGFLRYSRRTGNAPLRIEQTEKRRGNPFGSYLFDRAKPSF